MTGLKNPIFSFLFGGISIGIFINVLTTVALEKIGSASKYYVVVALLSIIIILVVGNYIWILYRNKNSQIH